MDYLSNKFNFKNDFLFKTSIDCFGAHQNRIYVGKIDFINSQNNSVLIDSGFPSGIMCFLYELKLKAPREISDLTNRYNYIKKLSTFKFKIIGLQTFFDNQVLIKKHYISHITLFNYILNKQNDNKKFYLKGRVLNITKGGYSIGLCGYVGFLPNSHCFYSNKIGSIIGVYVLSINKASNTLIVLSQKRLEKNLERQLWKLSSQFSFIKRL